MDQSRKPRRVVRKLEPAEVDSLVAEYQAAAQMRELAARHRVHRATVAVVLRRAGAALRTRGLSAELVAESARLRQEGWSVARLGEHFGVDGTTVWRALRQQSVLMT